MSDSQSLNLLVLNPVAGEPDLSAALRAIGHRVVHARDYDEVLEHMARTPIDGILLDSIALNAVADPMLRLRASHPTRPVVAVVPRGDVGRAVDLAAAGVDFVIERDSSMIDDLHGVLAMASRRRETQLERASHREATRFTMDQVADLVFWVDEDGILHHANDAAEVRLCGAPGGLGGQGIATIAPQFGPGRWREIWAVLQKKSCCFFETELRGLQGETIPVEISVRLVTIDGLAYGCVVARDIAWRRELDVQLRLAQRLEAIGNFTIRMAHDFNNLLTVISGNIQVLLYADDQEESERFKAIHAVYRAAERARQLTGQLQDFGRRDGRPSQAISVGRVLSDMESLLARMVGGIVKVHISRQTEADEILIDQGPLEQIYMNLAVNAREAMPRGGQLIFEVRARDVRPHSRLARLGVSPGAWIEIDVQDTGDGMPPEVLERAFDPFFTTKPERSGLGLSTVYSA
ncbi:MAG: hypothetical protein KDB53_07265, partial [Planctomycetes bacterium]|nr:hypothetical protein [Planctomycetota bacterium]